MQTIHVSEIDPKDLQLEVMPTGFSSLDYYFFLKQKRSELVVIGARPSVGKSAFLFQLAKNVAKLGTPVHIFSLEMDKEQILTRWAAAELNQSLTYIQSGHVKERDLERACDTLFSYPIHINDKSGLDIHDLIIEAKEQFHKINTGLIVVDYLQLLRVTRGHSKDDEIGTITGGLKKLAKDLKIPVVVASQLNRDCERRGMSTGDFKPVLSDLRESGNIEQDADVVALLHREARFTGLRPGEADVIIAKNRNGPVGTAVMQFTEAQCSFIDKNYAEI